MQSSFIVGIAVVLAISSAGSAQTLGDIARQEEARRKSVPASSKVYTNDSLRADPASPRPPVTRAAGTTPSSVPDGSRQTGVPPAIPDNRAQDEAYWKKRMADARDTVERAKIFAEALQTRINSLSNDWAARDDPYQRGRIGADRDNALAALDRVRKEIQDGVAAIAAIQEEARKAGVPAGWVR